jgi:hypothetical protein
MAIKEGRGRHARTGKVTHAPMTVDIIRVQDGAGHEKPAVRCVDLFAGNGVCERHGAPRGPGCVRRDYAFPAAHDRIDPRAKIAHGFLAGIGFSLTGFCGFANKAA